MVTHLFRDLAQARRREAPLRLGLALVVALVAGSLVSPQVALAWLALVVVTQALDAVLLRRFRDRADAQISRGWRLAYAACALLTAAVYSGVSVPAWLAPDVYGKVFALLLPAGALLNLAMSVRRAPRALAAAWAGHVGILLFLPWLQPEPGPPHVIGAASVTVSVVIYVAHLIAATRRGARAADELETALGESRTALERTAAAERRLSLAVEIADLYIYEVDFRAKTLTSGGARPEFLEQPLTYDQIMRDGFELVDPRDRASARSAWDAYRAGDAPYRTEYRLLREDGREVWAYAAAELMRDADGKPAKLVGIMRDVTERRLAEQELIEARDRAEAGSRAKTDFLAMMSHEIRTPLNGVLGMVQAMQRDSLPRLQRERLEVIGRSGELLLDLLNNALDLAKIEAGRLELEMGAVDVAETARSVLDAFAAHVADKDVALELEAAPQARGAFQADATRLRQVLNNLVSNAVKFTEVGRVRIALARTDAGLRLTVSDTGIGIAPDQQARLFEKFVQADVSTTRRFGGSGLGLAISYRLVALMGGTLQLESVLGRGSTFTVDLPLEPADAAYDVRPPASAPAAAPSEALPPLRVLAAEDNPVNQLVLKTLLLQVGVEPHVVGDGVQAVAAWAEGGWDIALMDVQMPEMDGIAATAEIRRREAASGAARTPILALTANVMSHQVQAYLDAGMDGVVAKPIEAEKLFVAMGQLLDAPATIEA